VNEATCVVFSEILSRLLSDSICEVTMSWLFGVKKGQPSDLDLSAFQLPTAGGGDSDDKTKDSQGQKTMEAYRFDSAALERAAKAAKDLERSRTLCIICVTLSPILSDSELVQRERP